MSQLDIFYSYKGKDNIKPSEDILLAYKDKGLIFDENNRTIYANGLEYCANNTSSSDGSNYDDTELRGRVEDLESDVEELKKREPSEGGGGTGDYDDTQLKKWISETYIAKGTSADKLLQDDGNTRDVYDSENLDNAGVGTQIPTVRSIKNALANYAKTNDLNSLVSSEDLTGILTNLKSEILGGAGEDYDTLKEIEEWIEEHQDLYQALISTVSQKATKEEVKTDITTVTNHVNTEMAKKANVIVCDNQYEFDNILTKDNNTIYLIKGDQDVWAAKEYVDELYELMVDLRDRVKRLEVVNDITDSYDELEELKTNDIVNISPKPGSARDDE